MLDKWVRPALVLRDMQFTHTLDEGFRTGVSIWADLWPLLWSGAAMNTDHVDHEH